MDTILGRKPVNAKPIKNERLRVTLAIFVAKTRLAWSEANYHQHVRDPIDAQDPRWSVQSLERLFNDLARPASKADGTIRCRPVDVGSI
jgi:hypothetical protein